MDYYENYAIFESCKLGIRNLMKYIILGPVTQYLAFNVHSCMGKPTAMTTSLTPKYFIYLDWHRQRLFKDCSV